MAYIATQVTVISGCSSLLGSMGPRAHTKYLGQAVGAIVIAPWVRNGLWRGSFLVKNPYLCLRVFSGGLFASNVTQVAVISGWNGLDGSMRPRGHVRHLAFGDMGHVKCAMGPKPVSYTHLTLPTICSV